MALEKQQVHRAGTLKQTNKVHKHGRHRSKGSISIATKGKVNLKELSKKKQTELRKDQRRHQALQLRRNKRDEVLSKKRLIGGVDHAPFLICIIPLNELMNVEAALTLIKTCDEEAVVQTSVTGVIHITLPRFKQHYSIVIPPADNYLAALDTLKVSDTVVFLASANAGVEFGDEIIDKGGRKILASAFAQGVPTPVIAVTDLEKLPTKKQSEQKQNVQKLITKWFPDEKVMTLSKESDGLNLLRRIGNQKRKSVLYRDRRPHVIAESYQFEADSEGYKGTLKVCGYIRGSTLSVNGLVYIPGLGAYQMSRIEAPKVPFGLEKNRNKNAMEAENTVRLLETADENQESLQSENIPDPMEGEQTWPTEEELKQAEEEIKRKVKKVPKGWSEYQAAWIPDDDAEDDSEEEDDEEDEEDENMMDAASEEASDEENDEEFETMTESEIGVNDQQYDKDIDENMEKQELERVKAAKMDQQFPDEMDTPQDTPARLRFQKYRGLESFRTSPWDPKENLPMDYARIFQFGNFDRTKRRIFKELEDKDGAMPGWFVTIYVTGIPKYAWNAFETTGAPVTLMGMHSHENKMSVLNVVLKRTGSYDQPIASKDKLIFQCGYRRFIVNPIFSQHTNGKKHKYERFFQPESTVVATFYAPIQFPPAPVLCFKEVNGSLELIATGNLISCNPDRIVTKRIVLSGHSFKVHKRSAVIRFMFFNREDILYFKPCKLRTRYGQIGHIKEPLGTHGHMKCIFDGQLKSQDVVFLNLYKRVFPKWTYEECIASCEENVGMET